MYVDVCSVCRVLGLDKVSGAFKDHITKAAGGDIQAFAQIRAHRDGSANLPLVRIRKVKNPSKEALSVSMKETDEEEAYVSLVEEDIASMEEKSLEAAWKEEMMEKADRVLEILTSGGVEEQWRSSTPGEERGGNLLQL